MIEDRKYKNKIKTRKKRDECKFRTRKTKQMKKVNIKGKRALRFPRPSGVESFLVAYAIQMRPSVEEEKARTKATKVN